MYLIKQIRLNRIKNILLLFTIVMLVFTSCKNENPEVIATLDSYLAIDGARNISLDASGGVRTVVLKANGEWEVSVPNDIDWIDVSQSTGKDNGTFQLIVDGNSTYESRSAVLSFTLNGQLQEGLLFQVIQEGAEKQVSYDVLIEENFDWLQTGNGVVVGSSVLYETTGELRNSSWPESFKAYGWESAGTNRLYAREGLIKFGAAAESDYIVSPFLQFEGTRTLKIEFKAVPYITSGGTRDNGHIKVSTTQEGATVLPTEFFLTNWFDKASDPQTVEIWKKPESIYSFEVKGATNGIRIKIGSEGSNQRFFLDDIVIKVEKE